MTIISLTHFDSSGWMNCQWTWSISITFYLLNQTNSAAVSCSWGTASRMPSTKRRADDVSKPLCPYGLNCYRIGNPNHTNEMYHPQIDGSVRTTRSKTHASTSDHAHQSINQSIKQAVANNVRTYSFSDLTTELLAVVCAYLELEFKCRTFPVLSHSSKKAFKRNSRSPSCRHFTTSMIGLVFATALLWHIWKCPLLSTLQRMMGLWNF